MAPIGPAATDTTAVVTLERRLGRVAPVTLHRPQVRNAVSGTVAAALQAVVDDTEADPEVCAVVLAGAAEGRVFCASGALEEVSADRGDTLFTAGGGFAGFVDAPRGKSWIAAVKGEALAGAAGSWSLATWCVVPVAQVVDEAPALAAPTTHIAPVCASPARRPTWTSPTCERRRCRCARARRPPRTTGKARVPSSRSARCAAAGAEGGRRHGHAQRHPFQDHRQSGVDLRLHRLAPFLLRQAGHWNDLVRHAPPAAHRAGSSTCC
jgi:hypothetical protein